MALSRIRNKIIPFKFSPFSYKQQIVMSWWTPKSIYRNKTAIICHGAVRSGKTVSESFSFINWAMYSFNGQNFGLCGKTVGSLRRNVVAPLKQMLLSRNYVVHDARSDNIITISRKYTDVNGKVQEVINYFYIFGGKDESSQDLIQGITLAGLFCDEVALMPKSFVNQATARCSVEGAKFWFSCNPNSPFHWFYEEWIKDADNKNALVLHFTMDDNLSLSDEVKNRYKSLYSGIFFKRYILGLWVMADGAIYPMFNTERHVREYKKNWTRIFISGDFGIQNATTFGIFGYHAPSKHYHQIASYYHNGRKDGQKTVKNYVEDLKNMIRENNVLPEYITVDPSAAALIVELKKDPYFKRRKIKLIPSKNHVQIGIQLVSHLLDAGKLTLDPSCKKDIEEFTSYVWDPDKLDKGVEEVLKINDHAMDKIRYACLTDAIIHRTMDEQIKVFSGKGAIA